MNVQLLDALFKKITVDNKSSIVLTYNDPRTIYSTVEEEDRDKWTAEEWSSPIDRATAIENNTVWTFNACSDGKRALHVHSDNLHRCLVSVVTRLFGRNVIELPTQEEFTKMEKFLKTLLSRPKENTSLGIHYGMHNDNEETIEEMMVGLNIEKNQFISSEEFIKAKEENNLCELYWYPDTPVGSCSIYASTLEAIITNLKEDYESSGLQPLDFV
jgi:hypothetical protein